MPDTFADAQSFLTSNPLLTVGLLAAILFGWPYVKPIISPLLAKLLAILNGITAPTTAGTPSALSAPDAGSLDGALQVIAYDAIKRRKPALLDKVSALVAEYPSAGKEG